MAEMHHFGADVRTIPPVLNAHGLSAAPIVLPPEDMARMGADAVRERLGFVPFRLAGPAIIALHLEPGGVIPEHDAPHPIICIVTGGNGFVRIGGPDAPTQAVHAGDAVRWPPQVPHTAWTVDDHLDVITVEYAPEAAD